jgi:hypothetical protein
LPGNGPVAAFPIDVGAQLSRVGLLVDGDHVESLVPLLEGSERARLEQCALMVDVVWKARNAGRTKGFQRILRLVIHQFDHGEARRDLGACDTVQALGYLVIQKLCCGPEQIDSDQPFHHAPDHFVAIGTDRGEIDEIVKQRQERRSAAWSPLCP